MRSGLWQPNKANGWANRTLPPPHSPLIQALCELNTVDCGVLGLEKRRGLLAPPSSGENALGLEKDTEATIRAPLSCAIGTQKYADADRRCPNGPAAPVAAITNGKRDRLASSVRSPKDAGSPQTGAERGRGVRGSRDGGVTEAGGKIG